MAVNATLSVISSGSSTIASDEAGSEVGLGQCSRSSGEDSDVIENSAVFEGSRKLYTKHSKLAL